MNDVWFIIVLVAGFTAWEGLRLVRPDAIIFVHSTFRWRWRWTAATDADVAAETGWSAVSAVLLGARLRGARVACLAGIPFAREAVIAEPWPALPGREGLRLGAAHAIAPAMPEPDETGETIPYEELTGLEVSGMRLWARARLLVQSSSLKASEWWHAALTELRELTNGARDARAQELVDSWLDPDTVRARLQEHRRATYGLTVTGNALAIYFFVWLPLCLVLAVNVTPAVQLLLYAGLILNAQLSFWLAHRRLLPTRRAERYGRLFLMFVYPADAIMARTNLLMEHLAPFHPLAVALALTAGEERRRLARQVLLGVQRGTADASSRHALQAVRQLLAKSGFDETELLAAPARDSETAEAYCPYCDAQYQSAAGACPECAGVALVAFAPTQSLGS